MEDMKKYHAMLNETVAFVQKQIAEGKSLEEIKSAGLPEKYKSYGNAGRWIDAIHREADGFAPLHGTIEHRAVNQRAVVMDLDAVGGLGGLAAAGLEGFVLQPAGGGLDPFLLAVGGEVFFALLEILRRRLGSPAMADDLGERGFGHDRLIQPAKTRHARVQPWHPRVSKTQSLSEKK